ncbi:unnamed protein product [Arctogadus glacialis]
MDRWTGVWTGGGGKAPEQRYALPDVNAARPQTPVVPSPARLPHRLKCSSGTQALIPDSSVRLGLKPSSQTQAFIRDSSPHPRLKPRTLTQALDWDSSPEAGLKPSPRTQALKPDSSPEAGLKP